jgi:hypothetical protein
MLQIGVDFGVDTQTVKYCHLVGLRVVCSIMQYSVPNRKVSNMPEVLKLWGAPLLLGGVDFMRDILILNEIWVQGKIYIFVGTLLG